MTLPDSGPSDSGDPSDPSLDDPAEIERLRQWIDHQAWDVFGDGTDLEQDEQICLRILSKGTISKFASFDRVPSEPETSDPSKTNESDVGQAEFVVPIDHAASSRFSNPQFMGSGAFGIVFKAYDHLLGIDVAIKLLRPSKSHSKELRQRFLSEARAVAMLTHPGIVRIFDTGQIGSLPYITTAWVQGGTLAAYLAKQGGALPQREAAWLISEVALAVHFAHAKAILHRDLKPSNILLTPGPHDLTEQIGYMPLLTDFGLAKRMDQESKLSHATQAGGMLGTTRFGWKTVIVRFWRNKRSVDLCALPRCSCVQGNHPSR